MWSRARQRRHDGACGDSEGRARAARALPRRPIQMSLLVVGSVALDSVETPFGKRDSVLGGSAPYFPAAASLLTKVSVIGVIGDDFPLDDLDFLRARGVDLDGLEKVAGRTFRWKGKYGF